MKRKLELIGWILFIGIMIGHGLTLLAQQQPPNTTLVPLPQRDQITIDDLQTQIANCTINAANESKYEAKLIARIRELEKQLADLKPPAPKAPPLDSKAK